MNKYKTKLQCFNDTYNYEYINTTKIYNYNFNTKKNYHILNDI